VHPDLTWNVVTDVRQLFAFPFMVNAFRAGTIVAVVAGAAGWYMVLRRQSFAGHTLSLVGFPGAAGAVWLGVSAAYGYFAFCIVAALVIAAVPRARPGAVSDEPAVVGTVQAVALAAGFLFVSLYSGLLNGVNALLFGSFLGVTNGQVLALLLTAVAVLVVLAIVGRPLLFASIDPEAAAGAGVPVRLLGVLFLVVLGVAVAEASQITGSLLVFALLVAPPATAQLLTTRPLPSLVLSVVIAVVTAWLGLAIAYYSVYPIGFWITSIAFAGYLLAHAVRFGVVRRRATAVT
jgi:zinc/manganese transport system permease protein